MLRFNPIQSTLSGGNWERLASLLMSLNCTLQHYIKITQWSRRNSFPNKAVQDISELFGSLDFLMKFSDYDAAKHSLFPTCWY